MTKREALRNILNLIDPYLKLDSLTAAQELKIGKIVFSNLKQAQRDMANQAFELTIDQAEALLRKDTLTNAEAVALGRAFHTNVQETDPLADPL